MLELNKKTLTSNFKATSKERHSHIFRNKTNPPDVGKYNPRMSSIDKKAPRPMILQGPVYSDAAKLKKSDFDFEQVKLCEHVVRLITQDQVAVFKGSSDRRRVV